jgi:hypothetical protein
VVDNHFGREVFKRYASCQHQAQVAFQPIVVQMAKKGKDHALCAADSSDERGD